MNGVVDHLARRADELRHEFDRTFAEPIDRGLHASIDLVLVRLGADRHALRISEIAGLFVDVKVTPCPSPAPALRGLAAFRGTVMPVYDLAQLVGYPTAEAPRWMVVAAAAPVALAFDDFAGHVRVEPEMIATRGDRVRHHVAGVARSSDASWPLVDISSVVDAIKKQVLEPAQAKE